MRIFGLLNRDFMATLPVWQAARKQTAQMTSMAVTEYPPYLANVPVWRYVRFAWSAR
jgi:hypothetical protein